MDRETALKKSKLLLKELGEIQFRIESLITLAEDIQDALYGDDVGVGKYDEDRTDTGLDRDELPF